MAVFGNIIPLPAGGEGGFIMSSYLTEHYQLHTWEPGDDFLRTEFNENFEALDGAVSEKCGMVFGTYTGNGGSSRSFDLGFAPLAVYVCARNGTAGTDVSSEYVYGGLALRGSPVMRSDASVVTVTDTGFTIAAPNGYTRINQSGKIYHYFAVK